MSKHINAGDTLTVGDLTDDHRGAFIEVETLVDITYRFTLGAIGDDWHSQKELWTPKARVGSFYPNTQVKVITPPPVVQPDEPTELGQLIRIEGDKDFRGVVADPGSDTPILVYRGCRCPWAAVLFRAGDRRIIVSDPPRWPDEAPVVPERADAWALPRAGDTFDRIEDMPYGWIAKVTLENGDSWGHVVRYGEGRMTHLWDVNSRHGVTDTALWEECGEGTRSGGDDGDTTYTLVEPSKAYDERVYLGEVPERIERGDWPADDTHLRDYKWIDRDGGLWRWDDRDNRKSGWNWNPYLLPLISPLFGPWTRGERVK